MEPARPYEYKSSSFLGSWWVGNRSEAPSARGDNGFRERGYKGRVIASNQDSTPVL